MIHSVIEQYKTVSSLPRIKGSRQQRLVLASLLADRSAEELNTFQAIAEEIERHISLFSQVRPMRFLIAAFLCRLGLPAAESARLFFSVHETVKAEKIARFYPQYEAIIALLLTLQEKNEPAIPLAQRVKRVQEANTQWRGLHPFMMNRNLLPVLTMAASAPEEIKLLVSGAESDYQQLRGANLKQSLKTMQYAWLLSLRKLPAAAAGETFQHYKNIFRQKNISGTTSAIHLLALHGLQPETAIPEVIWRFDQLKQEKSFRFLGKPLLLRIATQAYLREIHAQTLQEQAVGQTGLTDNQHDLRLIDDAQEMILILSVIVITDGDSGGDIGAGGDSGGDGGGGDGGGC